MAIEPRKLLKDDPRYFISASYENFAQMSLDDERMHTYEDPLQLKQPLPGKNPRKKANVLYESNESLNKKVQKIRDIETDAASADSVDISSGSDGFCHRFGCLLVTLVSLSSLVLVLLIYFGILRSNCTCLREGDKGIGGAVQKYQSSPTEHLEKQIEELQFNLSKLHQALDVLLQDKVKTNKKIASLELSLNNSLTQISQLTKQHDNSTMQLKKLQASNEGIMLNTNNLETKLNSTNEQVTSTESKIIVLDSTLTSSMQQLNSSLNKKVDLVGMALNRKLNTTTRTLQDKDSLLEITISQMNTTLSQRITNVSKEEGPQGPAGPNGFNGTNGVPGPQGAGNLSLCEFNSRTIKSVMDPTGADKTEASTGHTLDPNYVYTSFDCGGENVGQVDKTFDKASQRLECICKGYPVSGYKKDGTIICSLYYWRCPRI